MHATQISIIKLSSCQTYDNTFPPAYPPANNPLSQPSQHHVQHVPPGTGESNSRPGPPLVRRSLGAAPLHTHNNPAWCTAARAGSLPGVRGVWPGARAHTPCPGLGPTHPRPSSAHHAPCQKQRVDVGGLAAVSQTPTMAAIRWARQRGGSRARVTHRWVRMDPDGQPAVSAHNHHQASMAASWRGTSGHV